MLSIKQNVQKIIQQIADSAQKSARPANSIQLLAVSKTQPISKIEAAIDAGLTDFGENYVQEGVEKINHYKPKNPALRWHFIGAIQSNKTALIAKHFDWVHSIERAKIATRLSEQRDEQQAPLQVLIQINTSNEASKSGLDSAKHDELFALAEHINALDNLTLRGVMCIPAPASTYAEQLAAFKPLKERFDALAKRYPTVDTLSMGMSDDMSAAIAAGSTLVRIGSAIFGERH